MLDLIKEKWPQILEHLKTEYEISDVSYNTWLAPLEVADVVEDTVILVFPEESTLLGYMKRKYYLPLKASIEEITGHALELEFVIPDDLKNFQAAAEPSSKSDIFEKAGLNPKYTFSSFVVGENNNFAHAAALAIAESPAEIYNPLFIYGGSGLGKTHLMQAIAHFILAHDHSKKVLYVTSETFTNEIIDAVRNGGTLSNAQFREKYRNVDVLLIDDIQFIAGKESTQTELFHTFNALYDNEKQIVFTSDKPPKDINNLEERLCNRFLWGLTVDIQSPNYETRFAILRKKVEMEKYPFVPDDVLNYIATNVSSNIRELEGALNKIVAFSKLTSTPITLDFAESVLQDLFDEKAREITPDMIIKIVSDHFGISINDIISQKRNQEIVYPRQLIMYLCRTLTDVAYTVIGKKLGNRDHTTILHGYEKIQKAIDEDDKIKNDVDILKKKIIPV